MAATLGLTIQALLLGIVYAVLSTPAAYTSNTNTLAAIIWPAPAIAVAVLWQAPYRQWGIFLVAVFLVAPAATLAPASAAATMTAAPAAAALASEAASK